MLTTDGNRWAPCLCLHPAFTVPFLVPGGGENQKVLRLWGQLRELTKPWAPRYRGAARVDLGHWQPDQEGWHLEGLVDSQRGLPEGGGSAVASEVRGWEEEVRAGDGMASSMTVLGGQGGVLRILGTGGLSPERLPPPCSFQAYVH